MCKSCFYNKIKSKTTYTVDFKNQLIVVRNVSCMECERCGEFYFSDEVSEKIENIIKKVKVSLCDFSVIDYEKQ